MQTSIRLFSCPKHFIVIIPIRFFAFRLCRCSTVKSGSKREKLSLKTLNILRVEPNLSLTLFLFTQQFCPISLTSVMPTLAEKINNGTQFEKDGKPLLNKKTLVGFMKYESDEARKLAEKNASSACIDDETVLGYSLL